MSDARPSDMEQHQENAPYGLNASGQPRKKPGRKPNPNKKPRTRALYPPRRPQDDKTPIATRQSVGMTERQIDVLNFKLAGFRNIDIARKLGMEASEVTRTLQVALDKHRRIEEITVAACIELEIGRLEETFKRVNAILVNPSTTAGQKINAAMTIKAISESRRKLLGLDAPTKIELKTEKLAEAMLPKMERALSDMLVEMFPSLAEKEPSKFNRCIMVFLEKFQAATAEPGPSVVEAEAIDPEEAD